MSTLGIFSVKRFYYSDGVYYTYGGFGQYLDQVRRHFRRTVLVVHVSDSGPPAGCYSVSMENTEVVHLPEIRGEHTVLLTLPWQFILCLRAAGRCDVAHARLPDYTGVVGALACVFRGVPYFCQIIADWKLEALAMPWTRRCGLGALLKVHMLVYDLCERVVSRGRLVFAQGESCFAKHEKTSECYAVVSSGHRDRDVVVPRERFAKRPFCILCVARLTSVKNHELIVEAVAKLRMAGEDWVVRFVGQGPKHQALVELAAKRGISDQITFVGQLGHGDDLWPEYDNADVFVLASRSEGTPKVLMEAMCRGLPVVASRVGGIPSIVGNSERGLLFNDNDVEDLAQCLRRMASDPTLRNSLVSDAVQFARDRTVERVTDQMVEKVFAKWPHLKQ